ncbi:hypothetical protein FCR2A7T_13480 [Flavobacterium cauense R2A-7]|uniref:Uncharacterized protein n=1 Tax=Flavobacterium cauense R2A-7 TaxID=1341154 RepID=V6RZP0_9FLAO|nr:hypothetical protein [Flavobacterium cauense]ESU19941.1 hypothetical protein FCR2A7T_13480 [Flavobacterium cauense R2A-7]KGO83748.1 hypothetical protein Q762_00420 [Flavobacterium cauense R2A-7]TWI12364.1 hypothetical protein IP98_01576 [Flavobacterium cauense R2A-7]
MIPKKFNDYPIEYQQAYFKRILFLEYPFTIDDITDYEKNIDFKLLSDNHNINWDSEILEKFKDNWDWEVLQNNPFVKAYYNLYLLAPENESVSKVACKCDLQLGFCNKKRICYTEYDREAIKNIKREWEHKKYRTFIGYAIEDGYINTDNLNIFLINDVVFSFSNIADHEDGFYQQKENLNSLNEGIDKDEIPF